MKHTLSLITALLLVPSGLHATELEAVARHKAVVPKSPQQVPSRMHPGDAPILGNGDLVAAFAGSLL